MKKCIPIFIVAIVMVFMASSAFAQNLNGAWYVYVNYQGDCLYYGNANFSQLGDQINIIESLNLGAGPGYCPSSLTIFKDCDIGEYPDVSCNYHAEPVDMDGETSGTFDSSENYAESGPDSGLYWEVWRDCFTIWQVTYCWCELGSCPKGHTTVYLPGHAHQAVDTSRK